jgi:type III restriction enzyme
MAGFKFERNLEHQVAATKALLGVFSGARAVADEDRAMANVSNPSIELSYFKLGGNMVTLQKDFSVHDLYRASGSNILDISMETGTGKTYTYTKMMFELEKNLGIRKFIVIVPTLSIKAGTVNFLKSKASKEHFRQEYGCELKTYIVESKKGSKKKKEYMPQAVSQFVEANSFGAKSIHVLIINAGMINSDTMSKKFDVSLFDKYNTAFGAIASVKPFTIIDEPHKFKTANATWKNIEKFDSQYIIRYGATFDGDIKNLVYKLSAVDSFNNNLVKGVVAHVEEFEDGKGIGLTLKSSSTAEAHFELNVNGKKSSHKLIKKASLSKIHEQMQGLSIDEMNKSKVVLSNGLVLTKNMTINPYSYASSLQDKMIERTVKKHFELERELLTREVKIKPLTLFFIDDIEGYRDGNNIAGSLKSKFEAIAKGHIEKLLKTETDTFYVAYLKKSLKDLSLIHGGYFSKDNSEKDDKIEKEINEILHDKESLLSLDNVRRFIFSKWTLREGWDNPNVFQICKLRSSGSVTSKLQEVGRGLRLPVNEYMSRVKEETFDLHYYVDFTEKDFVRSLVDEINDKSGTIDESVVPTNLDEETLRKIVDNYLIDADVVLEQLDELQAIKRNNDFKEGGYEITKALFPKAFTTGLQGGKVRNEGDVPNKATLRAGKYEELKELWESINQKVVLEYKIENEEKFKALIEGYFVKNIKQFKPQGVETETSKLEFVDAVATYSVHQSIEDEILPIVTMSYKDFLLELSSVLCVNMATLHDVFVELKSSLDINAYLNMQTIRTVRMGFNHYLMENAIHNFSIGYNKISNKTSIHPTKFTQADGSPRAFVNASDIGVKFEEGTTPDSYLFEEIFYDSDLEKENINNSIDAVTVFTKIPKNSIRIPVAGGGTYSPDFAYVVERKDGKKSLNLIVETKDVNTDSVLREEEKQKIKHAEALFASLDSDVKVEFRTQLKGDGMLGIIKEVLSV